MNVPDRLESDHAASNLVGTDFHDIHLAHDPAKLAVSAGKVFIREQYLLENADTCAIAKLREGLRRAQYEEYSISSG